MKVVKRVLHEILTVGQPEHRETAADTATRPKGQERMSLENLENSVSSERRVVFEDDAESAGLHPKHAKICRLLLGVDASRQTP